MHWNLGAECGDGSYTNINSDEKIKEIPTPYDSAIFVMNEKLNKTYIGYGSKAAPSLAKQKEVDDLNKGLNESIMIKRTIAKSQKNVYKNEEWDMVDAYAADSTIVAKVDKGTLPTELKKKSNKEIEVYIKTQAAERGTIQKNIIELSKKREAYILQEKKRNSKTNSNNNLETEIERILKQQGKRYRIEIE